MRIGIEGKSLITPGPNLLAPALSRALNDNSRTAELVPHRQPGTLPLSVATPEPVVRSQTQAAISLATHQHQGHNPRSVTIKTPSATPTSPPKDTLVRVAPSWIRLAAALVRQRLPLCVRTLRGACLKLVLAGVVLPQTAALRRNLSRHLDTHSGIGSTRRCRRVNLPRGGFLARLVVPVVAIISTTGCCDDRSLPSALKALYSEKASERNKALLLISKCGHKADSAVPRIAQLMYDENVGVASSAAYALRCIDSKGARAALKSAEQARAARRGNR